MSLGEPLVFALLRAGGIALLTLIALLLAGPSVRAVSHGWKAVGYWSAMVALLAPGFATGFFYYDRVMALEPGWKEAWYAALVWMRYFGLAVLVVWNVPSSWTAEALHTRRLASGVGPLWRDGFRVWGRGLWLGVGMVFLLAFQEFELATTWNLRAWTVALFDAQVGGWSGSDSARLAAGPLVIQGMVLIFLLRGWRATVPANGDRERGSWRGRALVAVLAGGASVHAYSIIGVSLALPAAWGERGSGIWQLVPWREMGNGMGLAVGGTLLAWGSAGWLERRVGWRWAWAVPGMLGPMLSGLLVGAVFRWPGLDTMRDTLVPPVIGLGLQLLPLAVLLRLGIERLQDQAVLHTARLTRATRVTWRQDGWPRAVALVLLFAFAYGDFTINTLLAPPQFTSASVRLLNLLHYGRNSALGVMCALAFLVPLAAVGLTVVVARFYAGRRAR